MEKIARAITDIIASEVCGTERDNLRYPFTKDDFVQLYELSRKHDLAHLVGDFLLKNKLLPAGEEKAKFEKSVLTAVYRCETLVYEQTKLCQTLEKAKIPFIPLKGAVIRQYYPEPWMRTSSDIDALVREEELRKATELLTEELHYTFKEKTSHDVSLFTQGGQHIELHYDLLEDNKVRNAAQVLKKVWNDAAKCDGFAFQYEMTDAMYYFYHIAHMAKHFENGGCGVRPFLDIWILNHRIDFDRTARETLLREGGLSVFAEQAERLSEVWFGEAEHTEVTRQTEAYILRGGVYGTNENRITVQQQKQGGRIQYALSRIFIRYDEIKFHYPILQKHRFLTPIMEVRRWGKLIFCGHLKRTAKELEYNRHISAETASEMRKLLKNVGL